METIRAFVAVDIGEDIRGKLDELQRKLKKNHANVRWVKPRNIHLTLAFLGDLPIDRIEPLKTALDRVFTETAAFDLNACRTGFFGTPRYPRVIWAGVAMCPPLVQLKQKTCAALQETGIGFDEKPFSPHLTLGRVKGIDRHTGPLLDKIARHAETHLGHSRIRHVELVQSTLGPHGPKYTVLHRVPLK